MVVSRILLSSHGRPQEPLRLSKHHFAPRGLIVCAYSKKRKSRKTLSSCVLISHRRFTGSYDGNTATICQRVQVEQGFEYTFKANVNQNCIKSFGSAILSCDDNVNTVELFIDGVFNSGDKGIIGDYNYHEFSNTFSYVGPSIDSTDLCIIFKVNQGVYYSHYLDGISLTRGKAVPIPAETD
jgi:hypothetical protein